MPARRETWLNKSRIGFGIAVIALVFLVETHNVDRSTPNPASPVVWSILGLVGLLSLGYAVWCRHKAKLAGELPR
jgi:drug/metabolite transporter (DMT)-like permease